MLLLASLRHHELPAEESAYEKVCNSTECAQRICLQYDILRERHNSISTLKSDSALITCIFHQSIDSEVSTDAKLKLTEMNGTATVLGRGWDGPCKRSLDTISPGSSPLRHRNIKCSAVETRQKSKKQDIKLRPLHSVAENGRRDQNSWFFTETGQRQWVSLHLLQSDILCQCACRHNIPYSIYLRITTADFN